MSRLDEILSGYRSTIVKAQKTLDTRQCKIKRARATTSKAAAQMAIANIQELVGA